MKLIFRANKTKPNIIKISIKKTVIALAVAEKKTYIALNISVKI